MPNPTAIRHRNSVRLLQALFVHGPQSRAQLARRLGVMRSTVGNLVQALAGEGLVVVGAPGRGGGRPAAAGRPGAAVRLAAGHSLFAGIDLGVDAARLVLVDLTGQAVAAHPMTAPPRGASAAATAETIATALGALLARHDPGATRLRGLCVAVPGLVTHDGRVLRAPNLGWQQLPLAAAIRTALPALPEIRLENDANAVARAEVLRPEGAAPRNALFLWLDQGIGGAILSEGRFLRGGNGFAGEVGHVRIGPQTLDTGAPAEGMLESIVGRGALLALHRHRGGRADSLAGLRAELAAGEAVAAGTLDLWAQHLGLGLGSLASVLDPEAIVVGGPLAPLVDARRARIGAEIDRAMLPGTPRPRLHVSGLGRDAVAVGAALVLHAEYLRFDERRVIGESAAAGAERPPG